MHESTLLCRGAITVSNLGDVCHFLNVREGTGRHFSPLSTDRQPGLLHKLILQFCVRVWFLDTAFGMSHMLLFCSSVGEIEANVRFRFRHCRVLRNLNLLAHLDYGRISNGVVGELKGRCFSVQRTNRSRMVKITELALETSLRVCLACESEHFRVDAQINRVNAVQRATLRLDIVAQLYSAVDDQMHDNAAREWFKRVLLNL